jgi:hypothetical protein
MKMLLQLIFHSNNYIFLKMSIIKFYKCRDNIIDGIVENISDQGDNHWCVLKNFKNCENKYPNYTSYKAKHKVDTYNLLPVRGFAYININSKSYGMLIRHNLTIKIEPKEKRGDFIIMKFDEEFKFPEDEYNKLPENKWLQFGYLNDKVILQIKVEKVEIIQTNCDDVTGDLYFYSPIRCVVHIKN